MAVAEGGSGEEGRVVEGEEEEEEEDSLHTEHLRTSYGEQPHAHDGQPDELCVVEDAAATTHTMPEESSSEGRWKGMED